jgi:phosphoribosyl-AMP cyclohydrolase
MQGLSELKYDRDGLIPAIVQDAADGTVLMMAWMNKESLQRTIQTGKTYFWSRSRQRFWLKGEISRHIQEVQSIHIDCDMDCLLIKVKQHGAACHEGYRSCFFRKYGENGWTVTDERIVDPETVYAKK